MSSDTFKILEKALGHTFEDQKLLTRALTHTSVSHAGSYERMEFLGDRILGAIIADLIYHTLPGESEGDLAKRFTRLVRTETLALIATEIGLDKCIIMTKGEQSSGGRQKKSILADVCESTIAALYLDGGMEVASNFVVKYWKPVLDTMEAIPIDPKTELQELSQSMGKGIPAYTHVKSEGPDHAPIFTIQVDLEGFPPQQEKGKSKRIAEQKAARLLLDLMKETK